MIYGLGQDFFVKIRKGPAGENWKKMTFKLLLLFIETTLLLLISQTVPTFYDYSTLTPHLDLSPQSLSEKLA